MRISDPTDDAAGQLSSQDRADRKWPQFLETAVHDLNSPLRGIATSASLLSEKCGAAINEDARQLIERLQDGVDKMKTLLKALAEYAAALELDESTFVAVPTDAVVRSASAALAATVKTAGASVDCSPLPRVCGNWEQLTTLFRHLIANAIQYRAEAPPCVAISAESHRDEVRFAVRDNGSGIDPRYRELIFEPFQRLHGSEQPGAGLGLAICRKIVELHGGRIWIESQTGAGSTVFFTLRTAV